MWLLLIVLLAPPVGVNPVTVLKVYETQEECQKQRDHVGYEMAESYPYENDFLIVCQFYGKEV